MGVRHELADVKRRLFLDEVMMVTDACKIWPWAAPGRYGSIRVDGIRWHVHVLACTMWHGPRPNEMHATHGPCHEPRCWNGTHLSWATPAQNVRDTHRDGTAVVGSRHGRSKLTEAEVVEMRIRFDAGEPVEALAAAYDIVESHVYKIIRRVIWRHV